MKDVNKKDGMVGSDDDCYQELDDISWSNDSQTDLKSSKRLETLSMEEPKKTERKKILEETAIVGEDDINAYDDFFKFVSELLNIKYENGIFDFDEFDRQCRMDEEKKKKGK